MVDPSNGQTKPWRRLGASGSDGSVGFAGTSLKKRRRDQSNGDYSHGFSPSENSKPVPFVSHSARKKTKHFKKQMQETVTRTLHKFETKVGKVVEQLHVKESETQLSKEVDRLRVSLSEEQHTCWQVSEERDRLAKQLPKLEISNRHQETRIAELQNDLKLRAEELRAKDIKIQELANELKLKADVLQRKNIKFKTLVMEKILLADNLNCINDKMSYKVVHFRHLHKPQEDVFNLDLSKKHTYRDVVDRVAFKLGLEDPSTVRLTAHDRFHQKPFSQPINYQDVACLGDMFTHANRKFHLMYYETLPRPNAGRWR